MGQVIEVDATALGTVAIFDTDRTLTGQDGEAFGSVAEARLGKTFSAKLAERLFTEHSGLTNVYVYSNAISIARDAEWSDDEISAVASLIRDFLVYYDENRAG